MRALIDGDVIVYAVGYTTEDVEDLFIVNARVDDFISGIITETNATDYTVFLSDSAENNFRYKVDPQYKANRTQPKPIWYNEIKEYLISGHNARIAHGMEADDAMAIAHLSTEEEPTIICTIDKDLNTIPGLHYSWEIRRKDVVVRPSSIYVVDEDSAKRYFYKQMLIGDTSDNIKGITGIGTKKADKIIDPCFNEEEILEELKERYQDEFGENWKEAFKKTARLLWIKRREEEDYEFPYSEIDEWEEE